jgi:hypothetical protein
MGARTEQLESQVKYLTQVLAGIIDHCERTGGSSPVLRMAKWTLDSEFMDDASHANARSAAPVGKSRV